MALLQSTGAPYHVYNGMKNDMRAFPTTAYVYRDMVNNSLLLLFLISDCCSKVHNIMAPKMSHESLGFLFIVKKYATSYGTS